MFSITDFIKNRKIMSMAILMGIMVFLFSLKNFINQYYTDFNIFYNNEKEILEHLESLRSQTDANGVSIVVFHNRARNFTFTNDDFYSIVYEVTPPHLTPTTDIIKNIPRYIMPNGLKEPVGNCVAIQLGVPEDPDMFKIYPVRTYLTCPLFLGENIVGVLGATKFNHEVPKEEWVRHLGKVQIVANAVNKIINR